MDKKYIYKYKTTDLFSDIIITAENDYLTSLCFEEETSDISESDFCKTVDSEIIAQTCRWLDIYFSGRTPDFTPKYKLRNLTPFKEEVNEIIIKIPFAETLTYGDISRMIAVKRGIKAMSAQAVGGALAHNPICIILPCHRIIGANGSLTGYAGGLDNKKALLEHEREFSIISRK